MEEFILKKLSILCSYELIVRPLQENIRTKVLKYGPNEVRSIQKTTVSQLDKCLKLKAIRGRIKMIVFYTK